MKKLFTLALSAFALAGLSACGGASYSDTVLSAENDGYTFHNVGGYEGSWAATSKNLMTATSVAEVSKLDKAVADKLAGKSLKYLYKADITVKETEDGAKYPTKAVVNGALKEDINNVYNVKCIRATYNEEEEKYVNDKWISDPGDSGNAHIEALTDNLYVPPFTKDTDEFGMSWKENPVLLSGEGNYTFVVAQYTQESSATVAGFGFAFIKK